MEGGTEDGAQSRPRSLKTQRGLAGPPRAAPQLTLRAEGAARHSSQGPVRGGTGRRLSGCPAHPYTMPVGHRRGILRPSAALRSCQKVTACTRKAHRRAVRRPFPASPELELFSPLRTAFPQTL